MYVPLQRRFSVDEYEQMIAAGVFGPDERLELLDGAIILMSPLGRSHASCVDKAVIWFVQHMGQAYTVRGQGPLHLSDRSHPQPDILLLRRKVDYYAHALPDPADVLLLIEVADLTLDTDRRIKLPLYAEAGIAEVWIVNLAADQVEVYNAPVAGAYNATLSAGRGDSMQPTLLPDLAVGVDDILV